MEKANSLFLLEDYERAALFFKKVFADDDYSQEDRGIAKFGYGKCLFFLDPEAALETFSSSKPIPFPFFLNVKVKGYVSKIVQLKAAKAVKTVKKPVAVLQKEKVEEKEPESLAIDPPILEADMISDKKFRDKWWEEATRANLTVYAKNLEPDQISVYFARTRLTVDIRVEGGKTYRRICDLTKPIDPTKSQWTMTAYKLNIALAKEAPGTWSQFEVKKEEKKTAIASRNKKFEKIIQDDNDSDEEEVEDKGGDVNSSIQGLMKKLYNEGDDDMKRMIAETWTNRSNPDYKSKDSKI